jgi:hypothetical protein
MILKSVSPWHLGWGNFDNNDAQAPLMGNASDRNPDNVRTQGVTAEATATDAATRR